MLRAKRPSSRTDGSRPLGAMGPGGKLDDQTVIADYPQDESDVGIGDNGQKPESASRDRVLHCRPLCRQLPGIRHLRARRAAMICSSNFGGLRATRSITCALQCAAGGKTGGLADCFLGHRHCARAARQNCGSRRRRRFVALPSWRPSTQAAGASSFLSLPSLSGALPGDPARAADLHRRRSAEIGARRMAAICVHKEYRFPRSAAWHRMEQRSR